TVWVYLVKTKDEVYDLFVSFVNLILNQFNCSIKTVRSDNGTKFVNNKMHSLFNSFGIVHQTTYAYNPQQNGIAERKHMHLLNVARSLLFQSGIPLNMWTECILTAVYLINRIPSFVLNGKSSFEIVNLPENSSKEQPDVRKASRSLKMPAKFNDYMVGSSRNIGEIEIYKARLVAKGFSQREGFDFLEILVMLLKFPL
ncbi:ribonuclease H-like domain-containing protein, partial [Tanacetum coccineum]